MFIIFLIIFLSSAKPTSKLNAGLFDARGREVKPDEMKKQSDSERRVENEKPPLPEDYPKKLFDSARRENKGGLEKLANSERREENGKPLSEDYPKKFFDKTRKNVGASSKGLTAKSN